jgi:hypothetical protein
MFSKIGTRLRKLWGFITALLSSAACYGSLGGALE